MIDQSKNEFDLGLLCSVLNVSRQGYYAWKARQGSAPSDSARRREALLEEIQHIHGDSKGSYGSPRIHAELQDRQIACCLNTVARLMKRHEIRASKPKRFVPRTTDSAHDQPIFENLLDRAFTAELPNQKWVCDITYIPTEEGFLYLACVMDLCSRRIVGWQMADHLRTELCTDALTMAIRSRRPPAGLLHHSDRGVQYASRDYQKQLNRMGIICSMSRTGNCYDNAVMESFWGTLKSEHVYLKKFATKDQARTSIFLWIEGWYNRRRRHSAIGYKSPQQFEDGLN